MTVEFQHCRCTLAAPSACTMCTYQLKLYLSLYEFTAYNATTAFPAALLKTTPLSLQEVRSNAGLFSSIHLPSSTPRCVSDADADAILRMLFDS